jgi:hypothetical protein
MKDVAVFPAHPPAVFSLLALASQWASDMATKQAERYHNIVEQFEHVARASATPWLAARRNHFTASA